MQDGCCAREIGDRREGKARQPVEVSGAQGGPIELDEIIARARKRVAEPEDPGAEKTEPKAKP